METEYARLTVYFEDPFWVGLFERGGGGTREACKVTFGPEPKDCEVYAFLLENHRRPRFSPAMKGQSPAAEAANPKRRQRQIQRQLDPACGTRAQQALAAQREQGREAKKRRTREEREAEQERQFALRREKRREKHRGH